MKQADKVILAVVTIVLVACIITAFIIFPITNIMTVVGFVLFLAWILFILFHIALLYPVFVIVIRADELIKELNILEYSSIIHYILVTLLCGIVGCILYFLIPVLAFMLIENVGFTEGIELYKQFSN